MLKSRFQSVINSSLSVPVYLKSQRRSHWPHDAVSHSFALSFHASVLRLSITCGLVFSCPYKKHLARACFSIATAIAPLSDEILYSLSHRFRYGKFHPLNWCFVSTTVWVRVTALATLAAISFQYSDIFSNGIFHRLLLLNRSKWSLLFNMHVYYWSCWLYLFQHDSNTFVIGIRLLSRSLCIATSYAQRLALWLFMNILKQLCPIVMIFLILIASQFFLMTSTNLSII